MEESESKAGVGNARTTGMRDWRAADRDHSGHCGVVFAEKHVVFPRVYPGSRSSPSQALTTHPHLLVDSCRSRRPSMEAVGRGGN